jgi:hypothetical protein
VWQQEVAEIGRQNGESERRYQEDLDRFESIQEWYRAGGIFGRVRAAFRKAPHRPSPISEPSKPCVADPGLANPDEGVIAKRLAERWSAMSDVEKLTWEVRAMQTSWQRTNDRIDEQIRAMRKDISRLAPRVIHDVEYVYVRAPRHSD